MTKGQPDGLSKVSPPITVQIKPESTSAVHKSRYLVVPKKASRCENKKHLIKPGTSEKKGKSMRKQKAHNEKAEIEIIKDYELA